MTVQNGATKWHCIVLLQNGVRKRDKPSHPHPKDEATNLWVKPQQVLAGGIPRRRSDVHPAGYQPIDLLPHHRRHGHLASTRRAE